MKFAIILLVVVSATLAIASSSNPKCPQLDNVDGFLIDLDGTMYMPDGLIPGARSFYSWLTSTNKSYVFLSNTGSKGPAGVQTKLATYPFNVSTTPVPLSHIRTAADALADLVTNTVPPGSRLYILQSISHYGNTTDSCLRQLQTYVPASLWNSYTYRTDLSPLEIKQWATYAKQKPNSTYVLYCGDGDINDEADPVTHKPGYMTWTFTTLSNVENLVLNGAAFYVSAPDTHNIVRDPQFPDVVLDTPGPGTFFNLIMSAVYPKAVDRAFIVGKGGNRGTQYMMGPALSMLRAQGASGDRKRTVMIGDTLSTDIAAGDAAGLLSIFVLSGVNTKAEMSKFPTFVPTCVLDNVGEIPF